MSEGIELKTIVELFGSLGTGALFVFLYFRERSESQKTIKAKDCELKEINSKVLAAFEKNAAVSESLSNSIKTNTEATKTLTQRVTDVILQKGVDK